MTSVLFKRSFYFGVGIFFFMLAYSGAYYGTITPHMLQEVFAVVSVLVIAPSLALSGIGYFWNWGDTWVVYRKPLGVLGLYFGLVHIAMAIKSNGLASDAFTLQTFYDLSIVAGYIAVILFVLMPVFSNPWTARRVGGKGVRLALRYLGYAGYILVLFHGAVLFWDGWCSWYETMIPVIPPPTLVATIVGILVLILRMALWISQMKKKMYT